MFGMLALHTLTYDVISTIYIKTVRNKHDQLTPIWGDISRACFVSIFMS